MQAPSPILLLCVQILSVGDPPFLSILRDGRSQRCSYSLAVASHPTQPCVAETVVHTFAQSLRIVVRTLSSPLSCSLSHTRTTPTLRTQSNPHQSDLERSEPPPWPRVDHEDVLPEPWQ